MTIDNIVEHNAECLIVSVLMHQPTNGPPKDKEIMKIDHKVVEMRTIACITHGFRVSLMTISCPGDSGYSK